MICENILRDLAVNNWNSKTSSFQQFNVAVEKIEMSLIKRFRELRSQGLDFSFGMILASVDQNGRASIYLFDNRG